MSGYVGSPYVKGSSTSKAAAESVQSSASSLRLWIRLYIERQEGRGATCDEIEVALGLRHQTASARIRELVQKGNLMDSGKIRVTRARRNAVVWVVNTRPDMPETGRMEAFKKAIGFRFLARFAEWSKKEELDIDALLSSYLEENGGSELDLETIQEEEEVLRLHNDWNKNENKWGVIPGKTPMERLAASQGEEE